MTTFLVLVVIGLVVYLIVELKKEDKETKKRISYRELLPEYYQKNCEIRVKKPMPSIDIMYSIKGVLANMDDEWVMLEQEGKKKTAVKMLRIENIAGIKEIVEH